MNSFDRKKLTAAIDRFKGCKVAVVGDLMLDVYIWGSATRISPEAPVPVIRVTRENSCLGGAANVMRNLITLGADACAFGVIGNDHNGAELRRQLDDYGIEISGLISDSSRRTTEKQRVIAGTQQLLRIDYEDTGNVSLEHRASILENLLFLIDQKSIDAIIFEDYGKGVLEETLLEKIIPAACAAGIITTLDPKPGHIRPVKGLTAMKPNRSEAFAMAGMVQHENDLAPENDLALHQVAEILMNEWEPEYLVISLASRGMALFQRNRNMTVIPTRAREVFDVSGAGDTVIAASTLALASGADIVSAVQIANFAAGIVVGKIGTVTVSKEELIKSLEHDCEE
ncbi:MAG: PfkB family carbohydrate kinase [Victivallaceae bacterium]|nr:PfkB family carbohydrate kinase [Victivallaceae bacterium]NLK82983.1 D-glycero-beta-D-manno-heptose-7-phosphate kinase [Lentisphaerota bacterium]MDD3116213.1 PfkB family carbohydrate kinase [Victivallaceae bacterium]MDD3703147.1 PfkB family carbohydrate kinase [Victivallaceae bacterium]MDD4317723.1 PfkB family carbohydrate kinase [Victivallaceae bacterium]